MELPVSFVEAMKALLGEGEYGSFLEALSAEPSVSVRVNLRKGMPLVMDGCVPVPWCSNGFYLPKRPTFTFDPFLHGGVYYVQEASSMFLAQVVRAYVNEPVTALDMCAAPGGKSTLLCDALPEGSLLVSNEYVRTRAQVLAENMTKWGNPNVLVSNNGAEEFAGLGTIFDFIVVDAPCSGEGMFRKDEGAVQEWSTANVWQCVERQREILGHVWSALKPGGLLVYSTCTFNIHENEGNVKWLCDSFGAEVLPVLVSEDWGITSSLAADCNFPVYRFLPHKTKGEGLFMAVVRKPELAETVTHSKGKKKKAKEQPVPKECKGWIANAERFHFCWHAEKVWAMPKPMQSLWEMCAGQLRVLQVGIAVASVKGRDLIPEHALALFAGRERQAFAEAELDYLQAIAYLRKEAVTLSPDVPKGYICVTWRGTALGWVKNLGNRANNLYPDTWRIRSGHMPEEVLLLEDLITQLHKK